MYHSQLRDMALKVLLDLLDVWPQAGVAEADFDQRLYFSLLKRCLLPVGSGKCPEKARFFRTWKEGFFRRQVGLFW